MSSSNFRPIGSTTREGHDAGLVQYRVPAGEGLSKGIALARKIAANASMTAFAVMQALPRIRRTGAGRGPVHRSADGSLVLCSAEPLRRFPDRLTDSLAQWAAEAPDRTLVDRPADQYFDANLRPTIEETIAHYRAPAAAGWACAATSCGYFCP